MTIPANPGLQVQVLGTFTPAMSAGPGAGIPVELAGQSAAKQAPLKNGDVVVALMKPRYPGLHLHPIPTLRPELLAGHATSARVK